MSGDNWRTDPSRDETPSRFVRGITSTNSRQSSLTGMTPTNWRQPPPTGMTQNPSTSTTANYGPGVSTIKFMGSRTKYEFIPGRIACIWTFTEDHNNLTRADVDRKKEDLLTPDIPGMKAMNVFVKTRKVIVIARFIDHCITLPVFTHKGFGLDSKPEMRGEYVSIRNKFDVNTTPETEHGCIYTTTTAAEAGRKSVSPRANVWFTYPEALSYRSRVEFLGNLDPPSLSKLCELYLMATKSSLSTTLAGLDPMMWSNAPYSLWSEKRQRPADETEFEKQTSLAKTTWPANQTYSTAGQGQTYAGAATQKRTSGPATGQTTGNATGFQPLKRAREPEPSDDVTTNPVKRVQR
ncbi:hypothetical protein V499_08094 [Pseudogymnoascus sp. VKM F-103]|uniref:DUF6590 domain-containing protein n=1 Tax=Pseudogymnoascus verrucosus TaxID=342668 RepID=A0A1B8G9Z6_9PEZI|nr:uncharacterized protein VE01_09844 [Pseudogymnoascus verrucosus]KFY71720.1 hypothetical protein V499_08094 [Pseudogymnoascus sp. VKM F-103]OBT92641.1 hypothetical protein VE01_09844 [Pseudogymnoascus verrucosus]